MGLAITNNVASLTAQHNLNRTSNMLSKSLERLSSGLKINRGADGPAALVISEQQRAQIAGLQTAIDNTSKAVAMVQTTEGALNEVNGLLVKIRSLALNSANSGVNDASALAANQAEVNTALETIDRIANNTQFGSKKLLDGTLGMTVTGSDVSNAKISSQLTTGLSNSSLASGDYKLKITTAFQAATTATTATNGGSALSSASAATFFASAGPGAKATVTSALSASANYFSTAPATAGSVNATAVTNASFFSESGTFSVTGDAASVSYTDSDQVGTIINQFNAASTQYTISLDDTTHQFTITAKNNGVANNGQHLLIDGTTDVTTSNTAGGVADPSAVTAGAVTNASYFSESGSIVVGNNSYAYTANDTVGSILSALSTADSRFTVTLSDSTHQFTVAAKTAGAADNGVQVQFLGATKQGTVATTAGGANATAKVDAAGEITDSTGASLSTPILLTAKALSDGTVLVNSTLGIEFDVVNSDAGTTGDKGIVFNVASSGSGAVFQIGANAGQTATLSVASAATSNLGTGIVNGSGFTSLSAINVTTQAGSQDSLAIIDAAISKISTQRADLGAFQSNTLESTANNLRTTLENTTAAESVIRDTDFAAETSNFTKAQVLMQVGTTVLQNSNQTSQLILSLIRG
jgi:flagellin